MKETLNIGSHFCSAQAGFKKLIVECIWLKFDEALYAISCVFGVLHGVYLRPSMIQYDSIFYE